MPLLIEQQTRDIGLVRTPLGPERTRVVVRPGDAFRFVDDAGQVPARLPNLRVRRLDNNLIVDGLPDGREIELNNFFGACRPGAECTVTLDGLGAQGAVITEETPPKAPLADGSFLLYSDNNDATAMASALTVAKVAEASGPSWGAVAGVGAGLGLAAAAAGGGGGGGSSSGPVTDTTPPDAPVITSGPVLKRSAAIVTGEAEAGARVTLRVDVNGNGSFTDAADLTFVTTADASGRWQVDLRGTPTSGTPPTGGLADGAYTFLAVASDAAQNASAATRSAVAIDGVPPAAPVIAVIAGDDVVNAAERAAGVNVSGTAEAGSAVTVTIGGASATVVTAANGTWTAGFAGASLPAAGLQSVTAVASDAAGNASAAGTRQVAFETNVPGAPVITDNFPAATAGGPITFTVTFDKPVTGITIDDLVVSGGTKGTFTAASASVYTLIVTPTPGVQAGQMILQVPAGAGTDLAGNPTPAASPGIQAYDTLPPSVTITHGATGTVSGPLTYTFTWSEPVGGFTASDVTVVGGTAGALVGSGTTYSMVVTPTLGVPAGTLSVSVPAATVIDAVGLANTAAASSVPVAIDTVAPTLAIGDTTPGATTNAPVTFTFGFSEPVTGFDASDIVVTGVPPGAVGTLAGSGASYSLVVTPPAGGAGTIGVAVAAGAATDLAGNASAAGSPSGSQAFDTVAPAFASVVDNTPGTATGPVTFTYTFSEPVTGFTSSDVVVSAGASVTGFSGSGTTYSVIVAPPSSGTGNFTVDVPAGALTDLAGNAAPAAPQQVQPYAPPAPVTLTITDSVEPGPLNNTTSAVTFTFTFSEAVTGFTNSDVVTAGGGTGTFGTLTPTVNPAVYTLGFTAAPGTVGTAGVTVAAGAAINGAGTGSTAASRTQDYDRQATVTIADNVPGATASGPVTYTFTLSDSTFLAGAGNDFTIADINVTNGTPGTLTGSGASYSLVVTPTPNDVGTITVSVPAGAFVDAAGNASSGASATQGYNTNVAPALTSITDNVPGVAGGPVTFTFVWSEPVSGFAIGDVTRSGAGSGTFSAISGSGTTFTTTYTPTAGEAGTVSVSVAGGTVTDGFGLGNTASAAHTQVYNTAVATVNVTPGPGTVANGAPTPDLTPQVVVTLASVLSAGESLTLQRSDGGGAFATVATIASGAVLTHDEVTALAPSTTYDYRAIYTDAASNASIVDLVPGAGTDYRIVT